MSNMNKNEEYNTINKVVVVITAIGVVNSFFRLSTELIKIFKS